MFRGLVTAALLVSTRAAAGGGRHAVGDKPQVQAQLRPSTAAKAAVAAQADASLRTKLATSLGFLLIPGEVAAGAEKKAVKDEKDTAKSGQPVTMQVPEGELKNLTAKLSAKCEVQFNQMLHGKSMLHTFGDSGSTSEGDCTKLSGSLCQIDTHMEQAADHKGRSMKSTTHVAGKSCLPGDCMAQTDLQVLAAFMRSKAQQTLAGADVDINLRVDCSKSGGSVASLGPTGSAGALIPGHSAAPRGASGTRGVVAVAAAAGLAAAGAM
mmetsp:Transcript_40490/g.116387  ORF Transcript_40490/g.116387 Transcript_40490/m.116387 type:complete len:267 (-) Transcript_40490:90-890(-)